MSLVGGARQSFLNIKCRSIYLICFRVSEAVSSHNMLILDVPDFYINFVANRVCILPACDVQHHQLWQ